MRTKAQETFTTVRTEGGILPSELLSRIANGTDLEGLGKDSYHLIGEELNEAISRHWNLLRGVWASFKDRRAALGDAEPGAGVTRERWLLPLFNELEYGRLQPSRAVEIEGKSYPISHRREGFPIHLLGADTDLDKRTAGVVGAARTSPHSLVQEYLNRSEEHLWAFLSNGLRLRVLRDNASLTRQAYVEFDLEAMMDGEVYPDFVLLWLLCHQSRVEAERPEECWLERWSQAAEERGTRAREGLREGVEDAIRHLGSGFLTHRANTELRDKLYSGALDRQEYYRQLLRVVYRMLFLFVAEDRGLLLDPKAGDVPKDRYTRYYSTGKLRNLAEARIGQRHSDLYKAFSLVVGKLGDEEGCPELGLPALGSFIFDEDAVPDLSGCEISNRDLLDAVRSLSLVDVAGARRPVDYKNLDAEELGSVYESLLEQTPVLNLDAGSFELEAGAERKTTGGFYTHPSLVNSLLDTALDPVLDEAVRTPDPVAAILNLKVCDPAAGSGHFLIRAGRRIARRLAIVETGDGEPSPEATRKAFRRVVGRCLYGVDLSPMAVELCKLNLWIEALVPGLPLSFLDHHVKVGNSLLGTTEEPYHLGIPNDAFKPIVGDDRKATGDLVKRNREERKQWEANQRPIPGILNEEMEAVESTSAEIEEVADRHLREVRNREARYKGLEASSEKGHARLVHDAYLAAFVWPKVEGEASPITQQVFSEFAQDPAALPRRSQEEIERIAKRYGFFHWHLEFPGVFGEGGPGGFNVVLGNPPWERVKLQEQEWFAARSPEIATAPNAAARKRLINRLKEGDPVLHAAYLQDLRRADGVSHLIRNSGRFPLCGRGDVNTYSIFAETMRQLISKTGRVGCIVPSGIATDNTTKEFFGDLVGTKTLASLYDFENRKGIFPNVHRSYKFSLLTMTGKDRPAEAADFSFFALDVADLKLAERRFPLSAEDILLLNPNTRTCPIFRTRRDAEITKAIYRRVPVLIDENNEYGNPWGAYYIRLIHYSDHADELRSVEEVRSTLEVSESKSSADTSLVPVYESKLVGQYDHRAATYLGAQAVDEVKPGAKRDPSLQVEPRFFVERAFFEGIMRKYSYPKGWFLAYRDVARSTDVRSVIATIIPRVAASIKLPVLGYDAALPGHLLLANMNVFVLDFAARQKLGGISLSFFVLKQLPVLLPDTYDAPTAWEPRTKLSSWISSRVLELTYTAHDLLPFSRNLGYDGPPFRWDLERRFLLRCELDAAFFHLYGIGRDDADYIMETFPIVKRKDETAHGEYRTKRVILEIYDAMARATETGQPYATPLDPPPVNVGIGEAGPATVTPLHSRIEPTLQPEETPTLPRVAEERTQYAPGAPGKRTPEPEEQANGNTQPVLAEEIFTPNGALQAQPPNQPKRGTPFGGDTPNVYEAALALHACIPDGQKMERDALLADTARELGYPKLTRKVKTALNKALNAEHNAGRLKTDCALVWKTKQR